MAWNNPATWVAGLGGITVALLNAQVRDNFKAIGDAWTAYVPAWASTATQPVLNNGTAVGRYVAAGKWITFRAIITAGTTTTYGTGQYSISLPVPAHGTGTQTLEGEVLIAGAAYKIHVRIAAGASTALLYCDPTTAGNSVRSVTNLVPATFSNASQIVVGGKYEAA